MKVSTALALTFLPLCANLAFADVRKPAALVEITALDQCLANRANTQAVFKERFPHESCDITTTCDPKLVQSAATLARERCRVAAIDSCIEWGTPTECSMALAARWQKRAAELSKDIQARWAKVDRTTVSPFAIRRFDNPETYNLTHPCPDLSALIGGTGLSDVVVCALHSGFANVRTMEGLSGYLTSQEQRP